MYDLMLVVLIHEDNYPSADSRKPRGSGLCYPTALVLPNLFTISLSSYFRFAPRLLLSIFYSYISVAVATSAMARRGTVLITGCSDGGIGSALATVFQARDFHVFATLRDPAKASELSKLSNVTVLRLDVTDSSHIAAAVKTVEGETGGKLDYLINNAGRNHFMPLLDENIDAAKRIFDINVWGTLAVTQAFAPLLIDAQGALINITSISGYLNIPWMGRPWLDLF